MELLRLATAGSVDDGKSTLVGRLLYDSKSVLVDQLAAVERASRDRGLEQADLALLTDGLRAEREQGITIDVAYRYFATPRRRFVLADTPGHVQYTRNMVSGASNAELIVVLVDARSGVLEQTRRHLAVAALLRVPQVVLVVNKMDLVDYSQAAFDEVDRAARACAAGLGVEEITAAIPISALRGDNVVDRSRSMPWYQGPSLLELLETVPVAPRPTLEPARFPVQYVLRPQTDTHRDYRGYAGQMASGILRAGDPVRILPSGHVSSVAGVDRLDETGVDVAVAGQSVTLRLTDHFDVARGDLIVAAEERAPHVGQDLLATVCWLSDRPLRNRARILVKHMTRVVPAVVGEVVDRLDLATLVPGGHPESLEANEIGRVRLRTATPLAFDTYAENRHTGCFLLIDAQDGTTIGAGMLSAPSDHAAV
ncbi:MAG TPA: GTP-binding protein [Candidatus Dormibacteraeota bacterium]|jgi:sulfate adenylyltransferase subunit 1|nr:GTP-binding protein [Candidatus Dormibacteraeota bacterium]